MNTIVTSEALAGITSSVTSVITTALPVGIGILAMVLGIKFIPKIIKMFAN